MSFSALSFLPFRFFRRTRPRADSMFAFMTTGTCDRQANGPKIAAAPGGRAAFLRERCDLVRQVRFGISFFPLLAARGHETDRQGFKIGHSSLGTFHTAGAGREG